MTERGARNRPIILRRIQPFLQVQPMPSEIATRTAKPRVDVREGLDRMSAEDW